MIKENEQRVILRTQRDDDPDTSPLKILWRSVVAQGIRDLVNYDPEIALESALWLGTLDFIECCDYAALDHRWVTNQIAEAVAHPEPYRTFFVVKLSRKINVTMMNRHVGEPKQDD